MGQAGSAWIDARFLEAGLRGRLLRLSSRAARKREQRALRCNERKRKGRSESGLPPSTRAARLVKCLPSLALAVVGGRLRPGIAEHQGAGKPLQDPAPCSTIAYRLR